MIEYRQSIREEAVRLIEKDIREPADEIGALISEYIKDFDVTEQERILGVAQGMAIMRGLQEKNGPASEGAGRGEVRTWVKAKGCDL